MHAPHIKRCIAFGLADPTTLELTRFGREQVGDALIQRLNGEMNYQPRENTLVTSPEKRQEVLERDRAEHRAKLTKLQRALESLR